MRVVDRLAPFRCTTSDVEAALYRHFCICNGPKSGQGVVEGGEGAREGKGEESGKGAEKEEDGSLTATVEARKLERALDWS